MSWQRTGQSRVIGKQTIRGLADQLLLHDQHVLSELDRALNRVGAREGIAAVSKVSFEELQKLSPTGSS